MRRRWSHFAGILSVLLIVNAGRAAQGDWQYTRWGMTKSELADASRGLAVDHKVAKRESWGVYPDMVAPFRFAAHHYRAYFYFGGDGGGLIAVRLVPAPGVWCPDIAKALMNIYGSGQYLVDEYYVWHDRPANNRITLSGFSTCRIKYEPLVRKPD